MKNIHYPARWFTHLLFAPIIYAMIIPLVFLDICFEIYHRVCFPIYGIPYVKRSQYIIIDRHKLRYLNILQKLNCAYCGYANGLLKYASVIAGETEKYWCGIMHKRGIPLPHQKNFLPYGDKEAYERYAKERNSISTK
ncbi:MAG: hypothetical protein COT81_02000 [Candidatus Buchananbacteria bacterium CG10_big_fil_rev_8_21_14_0_10_42_9]|uniref:Uncharacterized protein n=1 Tax=Candidatus Buchananbacteria bacterium CG10_big_fil_rev_8_21_14_0_10_42_9 TaxID=1974526 RepID=A0A2H0W1N2_9BACT|nr:MAG: hypothetical protein COT81_02000 [Candidatus Buchananbacteria bacterium CG10_big_fil_rev_8_21_14_0_10_42_9]